MLKNKSFWRDGGGDTIIRFSEDTEQKESLYRHKRGKARKISDVLNQLLALAQIKIDIKQDVNRMRLSDVPYFVGNPQKIRETTGWNAQYRFEQGLCDVLEYWRNCK